MIFIKQAFLVFVGVSCGAIIASAVYAFITAIDVITRLAARTRTAEKVHIYEACIILGGIAGNCFSLFQFPIPGGYVFGLLFGICTGIFVGALVMSLAETLDVLPTINRRTGLSVGIQFVLLGIALGKMTGSLIYFYNGWG